MVTLPWLTQSVAVPEGGSLGSFQRFWCGHSGSGTGFCLDKGKVKFTLVQALSFCAGYTAHRGSRGIALPFLDHGTRRGEGSASRPGRSLPPGKTRYPLYRRMSGPQGRSGQVRKISPPTGIRSPNSRARSAVAIPTALPGPLMSEYCT